MIGAVACRLCPDTRAAGSPPPSCRCRLPLTYRAVELPAARGPLRLAGAWELTAADPRFGGVSALAIDARRFLAVSDLGAVIRFDPPFVDAARTHCWRTFARAPGNLARNRHRDAEGDRPRPARAGLVDRL